MFLPSKKSLLESPFSEPFLPLKLTAKRLLRTLLKTFSKAVSRTLPRTLLGTRVVARPPWFGDGHGTTKKLRDKDLSERSGELSGAICLKPLLYWVMTQQLPRFVQKILWCCLCEFLAL